MSAAAATSDSLAGKRIVLTRAAEQSREWIAALKSRGAEVLLLPTVAFAPPENFAAVDAGIGELSSFDWILFTSRNAVKFLSSRMNERGAAIPKDPHPQVAAVGPATARMAEEFGWRVNHTAHMRTGEAVVKELAASLARKRVLLPRSDRADQRLPAALQKASAQVTSVIAYRTVAAAESGASEVIDQLKKRAVDAAIFASPSAFHNLSDLLVEESLADLSMEIAFAAIGPTTAAAMREAGARVAMQAPLPDAESLASAIADYFAALRIGAAPAIARHS
jgi:uroporphyrinogen-III synthase